MFQQGRASHCCHHACLGVRTVWLFSQHPSSNGGPLLSSYMPGLGVGIFSWHPVAHSLPLSAATAISYQISAIRYHYQSLACCKTTCLGGRIFGYSIFNILSTSPYKPGYLPTNHLPKKAGRRCHHTCLGDRIFI